MILDGPFLGQRVEYIACKTYQDPQDLSLKFLCLVESKLVPFREATAVARDTPPRVRVCKLVVVGYKSPSFMGKIDCCRLCGPPARVNGEQQRFGSSRRDVDLARR